MGKTQLAQEYAHRFMADYDLVWWVPSERAEEISLSLAELARRMELRVGDNVAEAAEAALEELRRDTVPRWLLIFDNADNSEQLESWLPSGERARHHHLAQPGVDEHARTRSRWTCSPGRKASPTCCAMCRTWTRRTPTRVAEALGDLPLAIVQASAWLEQTGMPAQRLRGGAVDAAPPASSR